MFLPAQSRVTKRPTDGRVSERLLAVSHSCRAGKPSGL
jgi:hypothetical protein